MQLVMDITSYLATLSTRSAEVRGLKELPDKTKSNLTPLALLAPWPKAKELSLALDKMDEAYPLHQYFIDVDRYYDLNDGKMNEAKELWRYLNEKPAKLDIWWDLLSKRKNACPCLLMDGQTIESVLRQIMWARANNRMFCLKLNYARDTRVDIPTWVPDLVDKLADEGAVDYIVVLEYGWVNDPLTLTAEVIGRINGLFSKTPKTVPIAVSCTSFPQSFKDYKGMRECGFENRKLISEIRRQTNHPRIIYADWGSTRPRLEKFDFFKPPNKRIDYPADDLWVIARGENKDVSFSEVAERVISDDNVHWSDNLGIWGERLIKGTVGSTPEIKSLQRMSAARINIHLHRQAFYGNLPEPEELEEEWSDEDVENL